jgi:hypothetical protein
MAFRRVIGNSELSFGPRPWFTKVTDERSGDQTLLCQAREDDLQLQYYWANMESGARVLEREMVLDEYIDTTSI